jgi:hypothetical protein
MKIVPIFENKLFAIHYLKEPSNAFDFAMDNWTDIAYLYDFALRNKVLHVDQFIEKIVHDAEQVQDVLNDIVERNKKFAGFFEPLNLASNKMGLAYQKGKIKQNQLRFYAIRIDIETYLITGGAIKMSQKMESHPDTAIELVKLANARNYLMQEDVIDDLSFYELMIN